MAKITNHDSSYQARTAVEPLARTVQRIASRGPLASATINNPLWYNDDTTLLTRTINVVGYAEKRRAGR